MYQMLRSLNFSLGTLTVLERSLWEWEPVLWPPLNLHSLEHFSISQDYWWEEQRSSLPLRFRRRGVEDYVWQRSHRHPNNKAVVPQL